MASTDRLERASPADSSNSEHRARRIGLFGGSFDPPHVAHVMAAAYALAVARLDALWVLPCPEHPLGKDLTPWLHRFVMSRLAFSDLSRVVVSDLEQELGPPTRTLRTIEHMLGEDSEREIVLVVGGDILGETHKWYGWKRIRELAEVLVIGRAGEGEGAAGCPSGLCLPAIASSDIRNRLRRGGAVDALVPARVLDYISRHGLYGVDRP
ncbi:MAG: nicotinate (nicotinamide) nucleotide adenylyltransferase [Deltaproteobacteria bacterium]|nr:nicotinate (nicotinamide) nucleotide adenylyltransferase [Deltaproteobacteria bacterium]